MARLRGGRPRPVKLFQSVACLWPHSLQANWTRVMPFSAKTRLGAPHLPQVVSMRVLPCLMVMDFFCIVSRINRSASSRIDCFDILPALRHRHVGTGYNTFL